MHMCFSWEVLCNLKNAPVLKRAELGMAVGLAAAAMNAINRYFETDFNLSWSLTLFFTSAFFATLSNIIVNASCPRQIQLHQTDFDYKKSRFDLIKMAKEINSIYKDYEDLQNANKEALYGPRAGEIFKKASLLINDNADMHDDIDILKCIESYINWQEMNHDKAKIRAICSVLYAVSFLLAMACFMMVPFINVVAAST